MNFTDIKLRKKTNLDESGFEMASETERAKLATWQ